ncbi:MAG TPA: ATP-binding protein [Rhizomicrobium sp.]|nr:ATP-binding protein [Rhizomicrobium sp.]
MSPSLRTFSEPLMGIPPARKSLPALSQLIAMTALFALLNYMGSAIYHRASGLTTVKPFCGVALALCLIYGRRSLWPIIVTGTIGGIFAKQVFSSTLMDSIMTPSLAAGSLLLTYLLTGRFVGRIVDFRGWKQLVGFIAIAAAVSALSAFAFAYGQGHTDATVWPNWLAWWIPTTLSYVMYTPVLVLLATTDRSALARNRYRLLGAMAMLGGLLGCLFIPASVPLLFIVPLALLIVTMVCEIEGTALGLVLTQIVITAATVSGHGLSSLAHLSLGYQLYFTQIFLSVLVAVMLPAAAAITERAKLKDGMAAALKREEKVNEALRDSQKRYRMMAQKAASANRAKSDFLASMSHELRTPLNAILGFSDILKSQLYGPVGHPKYIEYAEDVHKSGVHLLDLINDILDLSKIDAGKMELREALFDVPELVADALVLIREKAKGHVALSVCVPNDMPQVFADKRLTKQILLNLLSNAIKFTADGGTITVGARDRSGDGIEIYVADTGIGMSEVELEKAFSHYGQVDSKVASVHQGTGLGLPISRSLARLQGGDLLAESSRDRGTRISLTLPERRVVRQSRPDSGEILLRA